MERRYDDHGAAVLAYAERRAAGMIRWMQRARGVPQQTVWPEIDPQDAGCRVDALEAGAQRIASEPALRHMRSMVVLRDGRLVFARTFGGGRLDAPANVHSVTKSWLSTLCGIAAGTGELPSLEVPVLEVLPETAGALPAELTLWHLLTMTRGARTDGDADMNRIMLRKEPWLPLIVAAPLVDRPGRTFRYDNATAHLAAIVLDRVLDAGLRRFADERLLAPLGIARWSWDEDSLGVPRGDGYLALSPLDLAKLGQLYLQGGAWNGVQVVPATHVHRATAAVTPGGEPEHAAYGLLWWVGHEAGRTVFFAGGYAGQHVVVVPDLRVVTVVTGEEEALQDGWTDARWVVPDHVVPAFAG